MMTREWYRRALCVAGCMAGLVLALDVLGQAGTPRLDTTTTGGAEPPIVALAGTLPTISNTGAQVLSPGRARLRGEVTDTGSEAPQVWFQYWEALAKPSQTQAVRLAYGRVLQEFLMMRRGAAEQAGETGLFPCF